MKWCAFVNPLPHVVLCDAPLERKLELSQLSSLD